MNTFAAVTDRKKAIISVKNTPDESLCLSVIYPTSFFPVIHIPTSLEHPQRHHYAVILLGMVSKDK